MWKTIVLIISTVLKEANTVKLNINAPLKTSSLTPTKCETMPEVEHLVHAPYLGLVAFHESNMYVLGQPKTMLHYPRLLKINPIPNFDEQVEIDGYMFYDPYWFGVWYRLMQDEEEPVIKAFRYHSLNVRQQQITVSEAYENGWDFLNVSHDEKMIKALVDLIELPAALEKAYYYTCAIYRYMNNSLGMSHAMSSTIRMEKVDQTLIDNKLRTVDIYQNASDKAPGIRSSGKLYKYFLSLDRPSTPVSIQRVDGISPWFQSSVLLGCPPNLCIYSQFDAAVSLNDGTIVLFFGNHFWTFKDISGNKEGTKAKSISDLPVFSLGESVEGPIAAAMVHHQKIYLFTTKHTVWISKVTENKDSQESFQPFRQQKIPEVFPFLERTTFLEEIDATIVNKHANNTLFLFQGGFYFIWNLDTYKFYTDYLTVFPLEERTFPRHISDFPDIPESVDAAMAHDNHFYFFYATFMFQTENHPDISKRKTTIGLIQSSLIDCDDHSYADLDIEEDYIKTFLENFKPKAADKALPFITSQTLVAYALMLVGVVSCLSLATVAFSAFYSYSIQKMLKKRILVHNPIADQQ